MSWSDESRSSRRRVLLGTLLGGLTPALMRPRDTGEQGGAGTPAGPAAGQFHGLPDVVIAFTEKDRTALTRQGDAWVGGGVSVRFVTNKTGVETAILVYAPKAALTRIHVRWQGVLKPGLRYMGDHWERSYGDLAWRGLEPERALPWYFPASDGRSTLAAGVKTNPAAFCFWQIDGGGVNLWLDLRNGGSGVMLGDRDLAAATVVAEQYDGVSAYAAEHRLCRRMCESPRLPKQPVYGGNDWYYAYGHNSAEGILRDSALIASLAGGQTNRPWMVVDDGWAPNPTAGPWREGSSRFPDMAVLSADMRSAGVKPGIWTRPLFTMENVPKSWRLDTPAIRKAEGWRGGATLDPTVPEVAAAIQADIQRLKSWGYELIKHDFSTFDLLGRWGFAMGPQLTDDGWAFADRSKTTAEIVRAFYEVLRNAAGDTLLLGCNAVGHLGAGVFELQRIDDDTSGRDWNRTRKMGVNTLAFRAAQHETFFAVDADCVGLTHQVPWALNRQWLDLVARSGTPLFVSAAPDAVGPEQRSALKAAFAEAAQGGSTAEPLDWMDNNQPQRWLLHSQTTEYSWAGEDGASPFAT
jgi:alpha-galactosidase